MNKTKIEWCDYTWNPVVGCKNRCGYCYAKRVYERFNKVDKFEDIKFYPERLGYPLFVKKPSMIFVGSMCDLFGDWIPNEWIKRILNYVKQSHQHTFMFLTKNPKRYLEFNFPDNCWLGTTHTAEREKQIEIISTVENRISFVSLEPLLSDYISPFVYHSDWIIIGALSGYGNKHQPKKEAIKNIVKNANKFNIPVFIKNSLKDIWGEKLIQEYPK